MVVDDPAHLDRVFHALAHPARRDLLRRLTKGESNLSALAEPLEMSFPAASKHVRVLEEARLVTRRVVGREHLCSIEGAPLAQVHQWLEEYRRHWEDAFERLDGLLDELKSARNTDRADE